MDFVVGHPRSGTTFLAELLRVATGGSAAHELLCTRRPETIQMASDYYEGRATPELVRRSFDAYRQSPIIRIDSNWKLAWILPVLVESFPEARFIHLTRDPRPNVLGCFNLDYHGHKYLEHLETVRRDPLLETWLRAMPRVRHARWESLTKLEKNCVFWAETHRLIRDALSGRGTYMAVRLEDSANDEWVARILDFLGIRLGIRRLWFWRRSLRRLRSSRINAKESEKREAVEAGCEQLPDYAALGEAERATIRELCGPTAALMGYDVR